jgi:hypothetical protein
MSLEALTLKIKAPSEQIPFGRGFYQLEEEILYLPLEYTGERYRFHSCLESKSVILHIDRRGRLLFIELNLPRRRWQYRKNLIMPERAETADIRFADFRCQFTEPTVLCDKIRETVMIRFSRGPARNNYYLAENLIAQIDKDNHLVAIWAYQIEDDLAGREIAAWRKAVYGKPNPLSPIQVKYQKKN